MADKINGKLKNGHSNCSFDIKCLGILLFFGTSYTNFLLAISALGKLCAAARRGSLYARTNGVQHCLQPISIQAGTPDSCHTECGGHYHCKNIQKQFLIWIFASIIFYSPIHLEYLFVVLLNCVAKIQNHGLLCNSYETFFFCLFPFLQPGRNPEVEI